MRKWRVGTPRDTRGSKPGFRRPAARNQSWQLSYGRAEPQFRRKERDARARLGAHSSLPSSKEVPVVQYRVTGIPEPLARAVRTSLASPQYGHPAHLEVATGYGPCRLCLDTFREGEEERILFTYQPFTDPEALPAPGPVFIHRAE